jgi:alkaline phosphatase D
MTQLILGPVIGGVTSTGANFWGRANGPGRLRAWVGQQADLSDAWLAGESLPLVSENGFAGVAPVSQLAPSTRYYYSLSLSIRPPAPASAPYPDFTTFPPAGQRASFNFAFGSCFRPESAQSGQIFHTIAESRLKDNLRFILMIGDQIYADDYQFNGIGKVATSLADYRAVYAYTFAQTHFRNLLESLPAFMTLDDHEVDDDWTWTDHQRTLAQIPIWDQIIRWLKGRPRIEWKIPRQRIRDALQAYWEHQGMHAPPFALPPDLNSQDQYTLTKEDPGSLAYAFTFGAAAFFVLDTRSMRIKSRAETNMLGEGQWKILEKWLQAVKDAYPVKFLVSSCSSLYNSWLDIPRDRWSGFPTERERLLHLLASQNIKGVYLLAGDLHAAHAIRADLNGPQGQSVPLWEFCSTPFEQSPSQLSSRTYWPLKTGVKSQELFFIARQHNFGVVRVDFSTPGTPQVKFEVYGENGELLGEVCDKVEGI